jgi:PIN domain nuclease of toxin-antitoxin system
MKILLDTHVLIWWWEDSSKLSKQALAILRDKGNEVLLSAATAWELAIKINLGKIKNLEIVTEMETQIAQGDLTELPVSISHAVRAGLSPRHHGDPFDRLLVAQAQELGVAILSADRALDRYGVRRIW